MTDNLRDRIAVSIAKAQNADYWTDEITTWEGLEAWQREAFPDEYPSGAYEDRSDYRDAAQAIIDDLGLAVETHAATHAKRTMTRIISAWEWDNQ